MLAATDTGTPARVAELVRSPATMEDVGLSEAFLLELALKVFHSVQRLSVVELASRLALPVALAEAVLDGIKAAAFCEPVPAAGVLRRELLAYQLTSAGRERASDALSRSRYAGPAPVPLDRYRQVVRELSRARPRPAPEALRDSLAHLVLSQEVVEALCLAFHSGRATLLFGASGNGKTDILTSFARTLPGSTLVPHALYAYGQVIRVFDPLHHERVVAPVSHRTTRDGPEPDISRGGEDGLDKRWVEVRTPVVVVNGELGPEGLELGYDPVNQFYQAPPHLKAQGGIFVVDDFGRQRVQADVMLNRWIAPMERRLDVLALRTGEVLTVPWEITLVLATNIATAGLIEEAFLRRIPYKIVVPSPEGAQLQEILRRAAAELDVVLDPAGMEWLLARYEEEGREPRGCHPRDLARTVVDRARLRGVRAAFTPEAAEEAWRLYFAA